MKERNEVKAFAAIKERVRGDLSQHWFEVAKTGRWNDWRYGIFEVKSEQLEEMVSHFNEDLLEIKCALDLNHDPDGGALAWIAELKVEGGSLMARFEDWTEDGERKIRTGEYRYFSIEFGPFSKPSEDGKSTVEYQNVLRGIAVTNRPVLKGMKGTFSETPEKGINQKPMTLSEKLAAIREILLGEESEVPTEDEKEEAKDEKAEKVEVKEEEAKELSEKAAKLAETEQKLAEANAKAAALLAEKSEREIKEVVDSMILSETNLKGFSSAKRGEVEAVVAKIGIENAKEVAKLLSDVVEVDTTEKGSSEAGETDEEKVDQTEAKALCEKLMSENPGMPKHVALGEAYAAIEKRNK
jgi:phage I-like protein